MTTAAARSAEAKSVHTAGLSEAIIGNAGAAMQELGRLVASLQGADQRTIERVGALVASTLAAARGELSLPEASQSEPTIDIETRRQEFVAKYNIKVLGNSQVSLTLPAGTSRLDLLNEAQALSPQLRGQNAVWPLRLGEWSNETAFSALATKDEVIAVDGNVPNSIGKDRVEQVSKGWNNVELADLATAQVAYFIAIGKDLFEGNAVRARGGALRFDGVGLDGYDYDGTRDRSFAASLDLASRN